MYYKQKRNLVIHGGGLGYFGMLCPEHAYGDGRGWGAYAAGVTGEIEKMDIKLKDLKNFLVDADRRSITDQSVQAWVLELREAMYDATNILNICQL